MLKINTGITGLQAKVWVRMARLKNSSGDLVYKVNGKENLAAY